MGLVSLERHLKSEVCFRARLAFPFAAVVVESLKRWPFGRRATRLCILPCIRPPEHRGCPERFRVFGDGASCTPGAAVCAALPPTPCNPMLSRHLRQRLGLVPQSPDRGTAVTPTGFLPLRPTQNPPDAHVRNPPGADAGGDVVSIEPLQSATILVSPAVLPNWASRRSRGTRLPSPWGGRRPLSGFGSGDSNLLSEGKLPG